MDVQLWLVQAAIVVARDGVFLEPAVVDVVERSRSIGDPQQLVPTLGEAALIYADAGRDDDGRALIQTFTGIQKTSANWITAAAVAWSRLRDDPFPAELVRDTGTPWAETCRLISQGDLVGAADLLAAMGARSLGAQLRLQAAKTLTKADPNEALRQLDLAAAFWQEVRATARLAAVDAVRVSLRAAAS
jgi:hypothetical protein